MGSDKAHLVQVAVGDDAYYKLILPGTSSLDYNLSAATCAQIVKELKSVHKAANERNILGLITTTEGRTFSRGVNLQWINGGRDATARQVRLNSYYTGLKPAIKELLLLPMPTYAAVTGNAFSSAVVFALAHDRIQVLDTAKLQMLEMSHSWSIPELGIAVLREKLPKEMWEPFVLTSKAMTGEDFSTKSGICDYSATKSDVLQHASTYIKAQKHGSYYAETRKALYREIWEAAQ